MPSDGEPTKPARSNIAPKVARVARGPRTPGCPPLALFVSNEAASPFHRSQAKDLDMCPKLMSVNVRFEVRDVSTESTRLPVPSQFLSLPPDEARRRKREELTIRDGQPCSLSDDVDDV